MHRPIAVLITIASVSCAANRPPPAATSLDADMLAAVELSRLGEELGAEPVNCRFDAAALKGFSDRCAIGVRDDCVREALGYWRGCGAPVDKGRGERLFDEACSMGSLISCDMAATLMADADPPRIKSAISRFEAACQAGYRRACGNLGVVLVGRLAQPTLQDVQRGVTLILTACIGGSPWYCPLLARAVDERALGQHFASTRAALRTACTNGHLDSCNALAIALEDGSLGEKDYASAAAIALKSCDNGNVPACNTVGYLFATGHGCEVNPVAAGFLFYAACAKGYAPACDSTAEALEKGWAFLPDETRALEYYRYACARGDDHSCKRVAALKH